MRKKITVIGAGNVGATAAQRIWQRGFADVVLLDIIAGMPQGKAIDLMHSGPITGSDAHITGTNDYAKTSDSDIVVVTSGLPRKPGMSRDDLLSANQEIVTGVIRNVVKYSPGCILIIVTNPLDAMAYLALHVSGFPRNRVMGMSGVLDTARMRAIIAAEMNVSVEDVTAIILGAHGDTMVAIPRLTTVGGVPITELLPSTTIDIIMDRAAHSGAEVVSLLKTGSAFYAPGLAVAHMAEAVIMDTKRILPVSAYLKGEYGIDGVFLGVPAKIGSAGVEQILEFQLTAEEAASLQKSAGSVRELVDLMKLR